MSILKAVFVNEDTISRYVRMIEGAPSEYKVTIGFFCWDDDNFD